MKIIKFFGHPYTVIISFLALLISGEHLGGFYIMYILLALPYGSIHSLLAIAGIMMVLLSHHINFLPFIKSVVSIIGILFFIFSLYLFFANDHSNYNGGTFEQGIPLFTFYLFGAIVLCSLISHAVKLAGNRTVRR